MLLRSKSQLINSNILHLTYTLVGTVDSEQESARIPNLIAFQDLLAGMCRGRLEGEGGGGGEGGREGGGRERRGGMEGEGREGGRKGEKGGNGGLKWINHPFPRQTTIYIYIYIYTVLSFSTGCLIWWFHGLHGI